MKGLFVFVTLAASLCIAPQLEAKTFYLKNGEQIKYKRYWQKDGRINVLITRDTLVDFAPEEVDMEKTLKAAKTGVAKKKVTHKKHLKRHAVPKAAKPACPAAEEKKPVPAALPPAAAKPLPVKPAPPAVKPMPGVQPMPARPAASAATPAPVRPANTQPGTPALQKELDAVYGKFYAATRAGNYNEQMKYVVGEQRKDVEKLEHAPAQQKEMVKKMMTTLSKSYAVSGCSVAPDGKSASLNTKRKTPVFNEKGVKIEEKDSYGTVDFVKDGNLWKIAKVQEK